MSSPQVSLASDPSLAAAALQTADQVSFKSIMLGTGPRFARDAFGPLAAFYLGYKLVNTGVGVLLSTIVALMAVWYEKKKDRTGNIAKFTLAIILIEAVIGLATRSPRLYLAQPIVVSVIYGLAFTVSAFTTKPLASLFANEMYPFPPEVKSSRTYKRVFSRISLAWGAYILLRSALRGYVLWKGNVESFLVINFISGVPLTAGLMTWSIWSGLRAFRRSDEWGWALRGEQPPPEVMAAYEAASASPVVAATPVPTGTHSAVGDVQLVAVATSGEAATPVAAASPAVRRKR